MKEDKEEKKKEVKTEQNTSFPTKFSTQLVKKFYYWKPCATTGPFSNDLKKTVF